MNGSPGHAWYSAGLVLEVWLNAGPDCHIEIQGERCEILLLETMLSSQA